MIIFCNCYQHRNQTKPESNTPSVPLAETRGQDAWKQVAGEPGEGIGARRLEVELGRMLGGRVGDMGLAPDTLAGEGFGMSVEVYASLGEQQQQRRRRLVVDHSPPEFAITPSTKDAGGQRTWSYLEYLYINRVHFDQEFYEAVRDLRLFI